MIGFSFSSDHKTWFCDKFEAFFPLIWLLKIFFKIILNYLLQLEFERVTSVRTNYYCLEIWNIYYNTLFSKQMTGYCRVKILMFFFFFPKILCIIEKPIMHQAHGIASTLMYTGKTIEFYIVHSGTTGIKKCFSIQLTWNFVK